MTQNAELARVKARIRTLTERTIARGCTEAEATAAADMVGRLLERYALNMEEIEIRQTPCVRVSVPIGGLRRRPIDACVPAIARFCDCKVWLARDLDVPAYVFFGFETDTTLASYLFSVIDRAMQTELDAFRQRRPDAVGTARRRAGKSFQLGMAARLAERLEALHAEREAAVAEQRPTGTALILVRQQVVEDAFRADGPRLRSMPGLSARHDQAYRDGEQAGDRVNLRRPVGNRARERLDA